MHPWRPEEGARLLVGELADVAPLVFIDGIPHADGLTWRINRLEEGDGELGNGDGVVDVDDHAVAVNLLEVSLDGTAGDDAGK